jgi:hypothetical protein
MATIVSSHHYIIGRCGLSRRVRFGEEGLRTEAGTGRCRSRCRIQRSVRLAPAFMVVACLSGLTACDPGYEFTIHNPCDTPMTVDYGDSDEPDHRLTRDAVTIAPRATSSWTDLDDDINPPFGLLLLDGPRAGERIKSETPEVTIPESACPR